MPRGIAVIYGSIFVLVCASHSQQWCSLFRTTRKRLKLWAHQFWDNWCNLNALVLDGRTEGQSITHWKIKVVGQKGCLPNAGLPTVNPAPQRESAILLGLPMSKDISSKLLHLCQMVWVCTEDFVELCTSTACTTLHMRGLYIWRLIGVFKLFQFSSTQQTKSG